MPAAKTKAKVFRTVPPLMEFSVQPVLLMDSLIVRKYTKNSVESQGFKRKKTKLLTPFHRR